MFIAIAVALGACTQEPPDAEPSAATTARVVDAAVMDADPCSQEIDVTPMPRDEILALRDRIRREKFDTVLPVVMRANDIDMWIYVTRETLPDLLGHEDFGDNNAVFIFTD
ncbi:MAG: hypothetical protein OXQ29_02940, partial [Rhodospirillaceae bacterium]|nr:hypothetical protein [Rhodospirillaceae bacterium]